MARLPILMYHNVTNESSKSKGLTISIEKLEQHLIHIKKNYQTLHLSELQNKTVLTEKIVIITFDDVTVNQLTYAVPLLKKHGLKATFFVPFAYIGKSDEWNKNEEGRAEAIMTLEQLKNLDSCIELGYHSFEHKRFSFMTKDEINTDFEKSNEVIEKGDLKIFNAIAFPYGNYPKKGIKKSQFQSLLKQNGMEYGFKIGNKINIFPFKNLFEINRIDVKGDDSILKFKLKLIFGKLKLF